MKVMLETPARPTVRPNGLQDVTGKILVLAEFAQTGIDIGRINDNGLPRQRGRVKADFIQQTLHHRCQTARADVFRTLIDLEGDLRQARDALGTEIQRDLFGSCLLYTSPSPRD